MQVVNECKFVIYYCTTSFSFYIQNNNNIFEYLSAEGSSPMLSLEPEISFLNVIIAKEEINPRGSLHVHYNKNYCCTKTRDGMGH